MQRWYTRREISDLIRMTLYEQACFKTSEHTPEAQKVCSDNKLALSESIDKNRQLQAHGTQHLRTSCMVRKIVSGSTTKDTPLCNACISGERNTSRS